MGIMPDLGNQKHLAIGKLPGSVACLISEALVIFLSAQNQGFGLYVLPIIHNGIHGSHLARQSTDVGHAGPVSTESVTVANAHVL